MSKLIQITWSCLFLLLSACTLPGLRIPRILSPTAATVGVETPSPASQSNAFGSSAMIPLALHIGYGFQGPWSEAYFTDPANPAGMQATGGIDNRLAAAIDASRLSVHAAIYNLTLNNVRTALIAAHRRGVDVKLVTESDNLDGADLQRLVESGVPVLGDRREGSMHDKFMVIDGRDVWTGSMNHTTSGTYADNNNLVRIRSGPLAANFEAEFAEMYEDDRFGPETGRPTPNPQVLVDGTLVETYFSPDDGVESALVNLIDTAQTSIDFLAYAFTSDPLGDAVIRAARDGIIVRGVLDEDQGMSNAGSELVAFRAAGLDVRVDGNPGQMHEKLIVIDSGVVVVGSYNFSRNANETNDENVLVIHDPAMAQLFAAEFMRIYALSRP